MPFTRSAQVQRLVLELSLIPAGFPQVLERRGLARGVEVTTMGLSMEPVAPVSEIVAACRAAGLRVRCGGRRAPDICSWVHTARPVATSRDRLRNRVSPVWLPTLPAA